MAISFNVLKSKLKLENEPSVPCDVCHKAKQTREPFPLSDHKSTCNIVNLLSTLSLVNLGFPLCHFNTQVINGLYDDNMMLIKYLCVIYYDVYTVAK